MNFLEDVVQAFDDRDLSLYESHRKIKEFIK